MSGYDTIVSLCHKWWLYGDPVYGQLYVCLNTMAMCQSIELFVLYYDLIDNSGIDDSRIDCNDKILLSNASYNQYRIWILRSIRYVLMY